MWHEHGGSGLGMQWSEVNELDAADIRDLYEQMQQQRQDEADAIKNTRR